MKISCGKRKLPDGTMMYVDTRGRTIYFGGTECEPPYKCLTKPIEPVEKKKTITKATGDIDVIMENITKLHKQIAPFKPWPKDDETEKAEDNSVQNKVDNEESSVNEEDSEESCMQKEDAAYVRFVCDNVFRSSVIHAV
jgi:hypothetical protein